MRQKITTPGEAPPPFRTEILTGHRPHPCSVKPLQLKRPPAAPSAPVQSPPPYCPPFFRGNAVSQTVDCRRRGHVVAGDTPQPGLSGCFLRACFPWLSRCHPSTFCPSFKPNGVSPSSKRKRRWLSRCGGFPAFQVPPTHFLTQFQAPWCVPRDSYGVSPGRQRQPNSLLPKSNKALPGVRCHPSVGRPPVSSPMVCPQKSGRCVPEQQTEAELTVAKKRQSTPSRQVPTRRVPGARHVPPHVGCHPPIF